MIMEAIVKKQGNSNVIILPSRLGFKPNDKVKILIINEKTSKVKDIAGVFRRQLRSTNTGRELKKIKKELWGE